MFHPYGTCAGVENWCGALAMLADRYQGYHAPWNQQLPPAYFSFQVSHCSLQQKFTALLIGLVLQSMEFTLIPMQACSF